MKRKIRICLAILALVCIILFLPIPQGTLEDGGTRVYTALTYKIVDWNRISGYSIFDETRIYFGANRKKSLGELFQEEYESVEETFLATVTELEGTTILVSPHAGEEHLTGPISFSCPEREGFCVIEWGGSELK